MSKIATDIEQSKKLAEILLIESADMEYMFLKRDGSKVSNVPFVKDNEEPEWPNDSSYDFIPCWSLAALLKLIPKHILRKDKIHYGHAFIPSFRWEITPTAIYYTDGNDIMDYVSFRYGENNIELIDAVFQMICWLKENNLL